MSTHDEIETMIRDCENRESKLTSWEFDFVDDIANQFEAGVPLTDKQDDTLTRIWDRVTS